MSSITTLNAGDSGSTSLGVINTNFSNLNTDKIEDDSADTLTNKTIDVDNNTVSNIETDNLKSTAKTGSDTKVVTGTAGSTDEIGKFNADGDLVSSGVSSTTTQPQTSSDDTTVPTSKAVWDALQAEVTTREMFVPVSAGVTNGDPYDSVVGDFAISTPDSAQSIYFNFKIPDNFNSLTSAKIVMIPDASETIQYDLDTDYGASGEAYNLNTESLSNETAGATTSQLLEVDTSGVLTSINASDYVGLKLTSDTTTLRVIGLFIKYA